MTGRWHLAVASGPFYEVREERPEGVLILATPELPVARLVAGAPQMFEALQAARDALKSAWPFLAANASETAATVLGAALDAVEQALRQAEVGESL